MATDADTNVSALGSRLMQMMWGFMASQAIHAAAKLAVFDVVREGPKTAHQIAERTGSHEPSLGRLLRLLTAIDLLAEDETNRFSATALGTLLQSDHPQSARSLAVMYGEPYIWRAWGDLLETIRTGEPAFDRVHGEKFFDYLMHHPDVGAFFNAGMSAGSRLDVVGVLKVYDFSGFEKIVDVAGGHGTLLRSILEQHPKTSGVLCDLPSVVAGAHAITGSSVASRCEVVGADMFESVPAGGDAYILKRILHDWSDAESTRILRNCRRAISATGRLLVMDNVLEPPNRPDPGKLMDLNMLVLLTGRERTEPEFRDLYATAGFRLTRIVPAGRVSIVEGVPV